MQEIPYNAKRQRNPIKKNAIAFKAVKLVDNGTALILDAESTSYNRIRLSMLTNHTDFSHRQYFAATGFDKSY